MMALTIFIVVVIIVARVNQLIINPVIFTLTINVVLYVTIWLGYSRTSAFTASMPRAITKGCI